MRPSFTCASCFISRGRSGCRLLALMAPAAGRAAPRALVGLVAGFALILLALAAEKRLIFVAVQLSAGRATTFHRAGRSASTIDPHVYGLYAQERWGGTPSNGRAAASSWASVPKAARCAFRNTWAPRRREGRPGHGRRAAQRPLVAHTARQGGLFAWRSKSGRRARCAAARSDDRPAPGPAGTAATSPLGSIRSSGRRRRPARRRVRPIHAVLHDAARRCARSGADRAGQKRRPGKLEPLLGDRLQSAPATTGHGLFPAEPGRILPPRREQLPLPDALQRAQSVCRLRPRQERSAAVLQLDEGV